MWWFYYHKLGYCKYGRFHRYWSHCQYCELSRINKKVYTNTIPSYYGGKYPYSIYGKAK